GDAEARRDGRRCGHRRERHARRRRADVVRHRRRLVCAGLGRAQFAGVRPRCQRAGAAAGERERAHREGVLADARRRASLLDLARTYREIGSEGPDAFYKGRIARDIAAWSEASGGLLAAADLGRCESKWVDPISTTFRGVEVLELPPPGQGLTVLQMLNILEG